MSQMLGQSDERRHSGPYATNPALLLVSKQFIDGALDLYRVPTRHVRVQHSRLDLAMAEQLLDVAKIGSCFEEVGGEGVGCIPEGGADRLPWTYEPKAYYSP